MIRDGEVAVLYSPGFGAGWYSWNTEHRDMLFDADIVALVEAGATGEEIEEVAKAKWPEAYFGGAGQLRIKWVREGNPFEVDEYDGSESIRLGLSDVVIA